MNPKYVFELHQRVALLKDNETIKVGRVDCQTGQTTFVKYEPELTREGWSECLSTATDIRDLAIVTYATYNEFREKVLAEANIPHVFSILALPPEEIYKISQEMGTNG